MCPLCKWACLCLSPASLPEPGAGRARCLVVVAACVCAPRPLWKPVFPLWTDCLCARSDEILARSSLKCQAETSSLRGRSRLLYLAPWVDLNRHLSGQPASRSSPTLKYRCTCVIRCSLFLSLSCASLRASELLFSGL